MQAKLSAEMVRVLTQQVPPTKEDAVFDVALPRFFLRLRPAKKPGRPWPSDYLIRYTDAAGHERKLKVGSPATMDLTEARKAARAKLAIVDQGGDPAAAKAALREQWSVKQAVEAYIASTEFSHKVPRAQTEDAATLRLHVTFRIGASPLAAVDIPCARRLRRAIETDNRHNARRRRLGGPGAAGKAIRTLSALLSWATAEGRIERNPLIGARLLSGGNQREAVITEPEQYAALFAAMDDMVDAAGLRPASRAFITVAALTGARRGELQSLRWGQVDFGARRIVFHMSKGARLSRNGLKREIISLPPFAADALAAIRPDDVADDVQVFVPRRGERLEINRDWIAVRTRAGLPADLTLHGLRHSVGTVGVLSGLSGPEVQKLLRHRNISTTARYVHLADNLRLTDRAMASVTPPMKEPIETG